MKCPRCKAANPAQARFCQTCGRGLGENPASSCLRCGNELIAGANFCHSCGLPVAGSSGRVDTGFLRAFAGLERLMPEPYLKQLLAARGRAAGERRVVTILFCDIEGSTAMAELLDPEDVMGVLNKAFKVLVEPIFRHDGTLARLMGDAVLAFFGAPVGHEDDAVRACRAALGIIEASRTYADELERERGIRGFNVRVGINTGLVVVGEVGTDYRVEYTAMGDAVNLAARMETAAESGTALLTEDTRVLVDAVFETADLGYIDVKGKTDPVHVYRLLKPRPLSQARSPAPADAPFVGRDRELARLERSLDGLREGKGKTIAVVGDHGLGKSRLVWQARSKCPSDTAWFTARGMPHMRDAGYWVCRQLLYEMIGVDSDATPDEVFAALSESVSGLFDGVPPGGARGLPESERRDGVLAGLARLCELPAGISSEEAGRPLAPETLRERIRGAFCAYVTGYSRNRSVVLLCDDLSWADSSSLDLLEALAPWTNGNPITALFVFRLDDGPIGMFHERMKTLSDGIYEVIEVHPLNDGDGARLLQGLLQTREIDDATRHLILERAEGNPFYIEQVSRSLADTGVSWDTATVGGGADHLGRIDLPTTVQSAVMSRIDGLHPDAKWLLQTASAIGRVFRHGVLERLADPEMRGDRLRKALEELCARGFLRTRRGPRGRTGSVAGDPCGREEIPSSEPPSLRPAGVDDGSHLDTEYAFAHAMTAEVAYGSLLKSQRREIHRRVAELYERLAPDRLDEWAPILVHHFEKGGIGDKAYVYAVRSARRAWKTHAGREAAVYYAKALDAAGEHAASGDAAGTLDPTPAEVYEELGDVYYQTGEYRLAIEQYDRALGPCAVSRRCVTLLRKKGQACEKWGKYEDARTQFEAALGQMRKPLDPAEAAHIYSGLGMSSYHRGNLEEARQLGEIALEMMEAIENERGVAHASNNLGVIHFRKKNFPKAEELYRKSLAICESLSDPVGSATAYNNLGLVALGGNDPAEAVRRFEKARELFERMGNRQGLARAYDNLSQAFLDQGLKDEAVEYMKKAVGILAAISEEAAEVVPEMWQSGAL